jgi:hypothetical protein
MLGLAATGHKYGSCPSWSMLRFGPRVSWFQNAMKGRVVDLQSEGESLHELIALNR